MKTWIWIWWFLVFTSILQGQNLCDLNGDSQVTSSDVNLAANQVIGASTCTMTVLGSTLCNATALQRVVNATQSGASCVTGTASQHGLVTLSWGASTSSGVVGYNAYRGNATGGPYTKLNATTLPGLSHLDTTTASATTYYYVATAVGSSGESVYSNEASATTYASPGTMQGSLAAASVTATKGTTAVVPVTLTNAAQRNAAAVNFTLTLPLWASGKVTVSSGTVATAGGKSTSCQWQKAGLTTIPMKCLVYGGLGSMGSGVMVNINIPLPATLSGTLSVPISLTSGSSVAGDTINLVAQAGKVTIASSLVSGEAISPTLVRRQGIDVPASSEPAQMSFSPNPRGAQTPTLSSLHCKPVGETVDCVMEYDTVPSGYVTLNVFSSNDEYVKGVELLTGPSKKENKFSLPVVKKPSIGTKLVMGVRLEADSVTSDPIIWP